MFDSFINHIRTMYLEIAVSIEMSEQETTRPYNIAELPESVYAMMSLVIVISAFILQWDWYLQLMAMRESIRN